MPDDLRRFVLTSISSIPYLEAALLLRGAPSADWDARTFARRLYVSESAAEALLSELSSAGIAGPDKCATPTYRYAPSPDIAMALDALAHRYAIDLVGVTRLIHSRLDKRAVQFAEAFKWKKDN